MNQTIRRTLAALLTVAALSVSAFAVTETEELAVQESAPALEAAAEKEAGYSVNLWADHNHIVAEISVPAGCENEDYDLFISDSTQDVGCIGTWIRPGEPMDVPTPPWAGNLDTAELVRCSDGETVAVWKLENPIAARADLAAPKNVSITRYEMNAYDEKLVFTGLDMDTYEYEICTTEEICWNVVRDEVMGFERGTYGDEVLLRASRVWEENGVIHTNMSPLTNLPVADGSASLEGSDYAVTDLRLDGERVRWTVPAAAGEDTGYSVPASLYTADYTLKQEENILTVEYTLRLRRRGRVIQRKAVTHRWEDGYLIPCGKKREKKREIRLMKRGKKDII